MYGHQSHDGHMPLKHGSRLDFGDPFRRHEMICGYVLKPVDHFLVSWSYHISKQETYLGFVYRYLQKAPTSWIALTTAFFVFVIGLLVGYMIYGATIHIVRVEDDFHKMQELKVRAEAADVAKSQVLIQNLFLMKYLTAASQFLTTWILISLLMQFLATVSHEIRTPMNGILGILKSFDWLN